MKPKGLEAAIRRIVSWRVDQSGSDVNSSPRGQRGQTGKKKLAKDCLISLSLVNLLHISAWQDVNSAYSTSHNYYRQKPPDLALFGALVISEIALSALLVAVMIYVRRSRKPWLERAAQWAFLGTLCLVLDIIRRDSVSSSAWCFYPGLANAALLGLELVLLVGCALLCLKIDLMLRISSGSVLALSPLILVSTSYLIAGLPSKSAFELDAVPCVEQSKVVPFRIVWLIFDELDQRFCFDLRPPSIRMPGLDRLRSESLCVVRAGAAGEHTLPSLASLISGRRVDRAAPQSERELMLGFKGSPALERWSEQPNIFQHLRQLGFSLGLVGWYHPYPRIFPGLFCQIAWRPDMDAGPLMMRGECAARSGIVTALRDQFLRDTLSLPLGGELKERVKSYLANAEMDVLRKQNLEDFLWLRKNALRMIIDPRINFLFIHLPIPHPLGIYNRRTDQISLDRSSNYFDNLELVDATIDEFRKTMEKANMWDDAVVILTSDHGLRPPVWNGRPTWTSEEQIVSGNKEGHEVPFLLKLRNQKHGVVWDKEFNTVITHDMLLAIGRREITTAEEVLSWLETNSTQPEGSSSLAAVRGIRTQ